MQVRSRIVGSAIVLGLLLFATVAIGEDRPAAASAAQANAATAGDPLLQLLVSKGVLNADEAKSLGGTPAEQRAKLLELLREKGVLSASDYETLTAPSASAQVDPNLVASTTPILPAAMAQAAAPAPPPAPPAVVPAIAPVRVFPVDPPKTGGLNGIKVGPLTLAPYGFIKATFVHDSSDPDGDDFPFPGLFLNTGYATFTNTGPTEDPEVHVKARSTRFGLNLEWPDLSKNLTVTGKIEGDFEGNFTSVDNADVSSIRNSAPRIRLAFVRLDYHAGENTNIFFVGGQDWTLFGSGAMENILETTFNGAYWGNIYTRSPQLRGGLIETLSKENHINLEGQFGVMMPSTAQVEKLCWYGAQAGNGTCLGGFEAQQGQGEREGADSDRPELEARAALSFQLDKARGVAPAQIALAGFHARRTSIAFNSSAPYADLCASTNYCATFPNGFEASSKMYGGQIVLQVPTRWFTLVGSAYRGGDLRFYLGGQINSFVTDTGGLTGIQGGNGVLPGFPTLDGGPLTAAGAAVLGCSGTFTATGPTDANDITPGACSGTVVVAPQKPIRSFGGFAQLGLPLSRWFNADPKGHNAGWQLQFLIGKDQVVDRDLNNPNFSGNANTAAPLPMAMGKSFVATLNYRFNNWCGFSFEQSIYATRMLDGDKVYTIAGSPSNEWQDHRTEFGPIFTF